jgi:hypothetical protein
MRCGWLMLALAAALASFPAQATLLGADIRIGDITVIEADPAVLQPGEAFDLNGKTVTLSPRSGGGYTATTGALNFDSATGSPLSGVGDDTSTSVALDFSFPFLGFSWTSVWVNSNGHLTFGLPSGEFHFYSGGVNRLSSGSDLSGILDQMAFNRARVAALWQDWNPIAGGAVLANALSNRVVVTWSGVPLYSTQTNPATVPVTATFQVVLFKSGVIQLNYQNVAATPAGGYLIGVSPGSVSEFETTTVDFSRGGSSISAFPTFEPLVQVFGSMSAPFSPASPAPRGPLVHINAVARKFYTLNPDSTDQIVMLANFTHSLGNALAYELTLRQTVAGIGQGAPDPSTGISSFFGSGGTLTSLVNMNRLGVWNNDPSARTFGTDSMLSIMGQETGHQWLSFFRYDDGATCNSALLGRDQAHWSFFMDSDASDMEGNDWRDNGNGTFTTVDATSRFSLLDQYAMGLVPASSVPNTFFIQNPTVTSPAGATRSVESSPELNVTASGTRVNVTINQIVSSRCNVPRSPASGFTAVNPTNRWRQSFVLLIPAGTSAPQADLNKIDGFRSAWTSYFVAAGPVTAPGSTSRGPIRAPMRSPSSWKESPAPREPMPKSPFSALRGTSISTQPSPPA